MSATPIAEQRAIVLREVVEPALGIGFGTGLNLTGYWSLSTLQKDLHTTSTRKDSLANEVKTLTVPGTVQAGRD